MLKRNSGFIVGCIVAAGASFFSADILITEVLPDKDGAVTILPETGTATALEAEKLENKTYETDAFTIMASGTIIKGVESEKPETETDEKDHLVQDETDSEEASGSDDSQGSSDGSINNGSYDDGSTGSDSYDDGSTGGDSYGDGSTGGDSYGGGSTGGDNSGGNSIEITDPGNGDYSYGDNSSGSSDGNSGNSSEGSTGGSSDSNAWTPDDTIISGICSRYIDVSELYSYGPTKLRLIRNEIFAVHGRIFKSQDLMDYFCQKSWYVPTYNPEDFDANMFYYLNDYEKANLKLILAYEDWLATQ